VAKQVGICDTDRPSLTLIGKDKNDVTLVQAVSPKGSQTQGKTGNNLSECQCIVDIGLSLVVMDVVSRRRSILVISSTSQTPVYQQWVYLLISFSSCLYCLCCVWSDAES
jgi:hypothetical protein